MPAPPPPPPPPPPPLFAPVMNTPRKAGKYIYVEPFYLFRLKYIYQSNLITARLFPLAGSIQKDTKSYNANENNNIGNAKMTNGTANHMKVATSNSSLQEELRRRVNTQQAHQRNFSIPKKNCKCAN